MPAARARKAVAGSLIGQGGSEDRRRRHGNYRCRCGLAHVQESDDPIINRWCGDCRKITKQKFLSLWTP